MYDLRNAITATLAYYDIFEYPLTVPEIYKYLINPVRLEHSHASVRKISIADIDIEVDRMVQGGKAEMVNGFYALPGRGHRLYKVRMERQKIAIGKYKKLLSYAKWFQVIPYLRGVFVSGSLAIFNSTPKGDFDVMVIGRGGRLYTCRMLLTFLASFMHVRRTRHDQEAPDTFCFNHYIGDDQLSLEHMSIYTAHTYAQMIPIISVGASGDRFFSSNLWLNQFLYNFKPVQYSEQLKVRESRSLRGIARLGEYILDSRLGEYTEKLLKKYQQKRIRENPATHESGGRIIFTDSHMEFHPRSFETVVIHRYNESLRQLIVPLPPHEADSGLTAY